MTKDRPITQRRRAESGYAMLMVVFMAALMIIAAAAVQTNILTQGRREKEEELIWRGKQYMRGIYLFQRKNGRFPNSIDELVKPGIGVRYMAAAVRWTSGTDHREREGESIGRLVRGSECAERLWSESAEWIRDKRARFGCRESAGTIWKRWNAGNVAVVQRIRI